MGKTSENAGASQGRPVPDPGVQDGRGPVKDRQQRASLGRWPALGLAVSDLQDTELAELRCPAVPGEIHALQVWPRWPADLRHRPF